MADINKLGATLKNDTTDNKRTEKRWTKLPTLRKIKRAATRTQAQANCRHFILPNHTKPTHHPTSGQRTV
jgi:hypothetical protein